jgi:agmatinase
MSQESAFDYLRHGQIPFFRLPSAKHGDGDDRYRGAQAVLLGVPFDGGTTYQPGARMAPYHVRRVSALVQGFHPIHRLDVFRTLAAVDGGNVPFPPFDAAAVRQKVQQEVEAVYRANAIPFLVGGDHSVALPSLRAAAAARGPVAVVHVDAHLDTSGPEVWGEAFHHGTPLRHAIAEGLIERGQLYQIGIRAPFGHPEEDALVHAHGARIFGMEEIDARGATVVAGEIAERIGDRLVYLTFDVDGIDPAFAPGTGTPVPGGLSSREALALLRGLVGIRLCGMDLVEVAPNLDHADMTCHLAAHLLFEVLALAALRARLDV